MGCDDAKNLVKKFHTLQEERVATYRQFDDGHKAYMQAAPNYNFPMYRQLVHEVTETFKRISEEILIIKERMASTHNLPAAAKIIEKIQEKEQQKLELTAKLQISTQNVIDHPKDANHRQDVQNYKSSLKEKVEKINDLLEDFKYECEDVLTS